MMPDLNPDLLKQLAKKWLDGSITAQELSLLDQWYNQGSPEEINWDSADRNEQELKARLYDKVQLELNLAASEVSVLHSPDGGYPLWKKLVAAAAVALIAVSVYFFNLSRYPEREPRYANDIAPGNSAATLTLANGKKIRLDAAASGVLAREAGISITKTADGQLVYELKEATADAHKMNTLTTAKGETYILILPDKTKVWMNAASTITYAANLIDGGLRSVNLAGEAYFEVAKDKKHPFIVKTAKQEVQVLGTHFNVSSYADESVTKTTLLEGIVRVAAGGKNSTLRPNQQSIVTGNAIEIKEVNAAGAVAWKDGKFRFSNEPLETIMKQLARWYNVEVIYDRESLKAEKFGGFIDRDNNISAVLKMLERTEEVRFKIDGKKITVE